MKLSDVKGERTLEVVADLIDPICDIAQDEEAAALFHKEKLPRGMTVRQFSLERIKKSVPKLLKNHKESIISILSSIAGVTKEEYENSLNLVKLTADFIDILNDEAFSVLFISAQNQTESGSAQANTEAQKA